MITKKEMIALLAAKQNISLTQARENYESLESVVKEVLVSHQEVVLYPSVGKLVLQHRPAHSGRNPQTGEKMNVAAKTVVRYRPSSALKRMVQNVKVNK
ncbi:HU family DNA-binding protein [Candidatus Phytoplasma pruni]|uniref:HU family DNA-binding protein n=1 Tax=Candidatus Phytoplasma pruni TaxID=479893 RepID=A0A851HI44_9MOLU|nr:HU family DNA-binding protein [Candidatus Phytoplasma pruni]NWN45974.1 HU family DNA-binding protein [Candidatus Phytoplasma pruni]